MKKLLSTFVILFTISILQITAQNKVYTPTQVAPMDGETEQASDAILSWDPVSGVYGPVKYDVQVATDAAFSNIIVNAQTTLGGYQNSDLNFGDTYYWKVRAVDGPDISDWSPVWSFQVQFYTGLSSPNIYKEDLDVKITIEWEEMTGIYEYQVQYDTSYFWEVVPEVTTEGLNDLAILRDSSAWVVGNAGLIMHWDGASWEVVQDGLTSEDIHSVVFFDENNGIAVGGAGLILHYDGTDWTVDGSGITGADLLGVDYGDASNAWAVGDSGKVLHYDGTNWMLETSGTSDMLYAVDFIAPDNGWAVGEDGILLSYDTQWNTETSPITSDLYGIAFADANNGWAVGKSGKMMKYNGTEWMQKENVINEHLYSIKMRDADNAFITGDDGTYLVYQEGYWVQQSLYFDEVFNAAYILNENFGLAVSENGNIILYDGMGFNSPNNILTYEGSVTEDSLNFLAYGDYYFWRVRGVNNSGTSAWSPVYSFLTKAAVELESPDDNDDEVNPLNQFKWSNIKGSELFTIQFDTDPTFPSPTTYTTKELMNDYSFTDFGVTWYWRVQASHINAVSDWSEVWSFTIIDKVTLLTPTNGAENVQLRPTLTWEAIEGVDSYEIVYDTLTDFSTATPQFILAPDHEYKVFLPLKEGKEYYWKVRATLIHQETAWSDSNKFTVIGPAGIQELFNNTLNVYPNPSKGHLNISLNTDSKTEVNVSVTDLVGQVHQQHALTFSEGINNHRLNLENLSNGIYIIRISSGESVVTRKINLFK